MTLQAPSRGFGQTLLADGLLTEEELRAALSVQTQRKVRLGEAAVSLGFLTEAQLAQALAKLFSLDYAELADDDEAIDMAVVELVPELLARRYDLIALRKDDETLTVAMADPFDVRAIDALRVETGLRLRKVISHRAAVRRAIDKCYHASSRLAQSMAHLLAEEGKPGQPASLHGGPDAAAQTDQLTLEASDPPVVQFVNLLLMRAIQERASDIHIEPQEQGVIIRLRVDGILREVNAPPKPMLQAITTRIKLLANMDIAERRLPQDGRFNFTVFDRAIDVRLSCLPLLFGEKLVLRILDRGALILDLQSLGFEPAMLETFQRVLRLPHGLAILTGPTGSGKTTTLYAALHTINSPTKNIMTIEDPVEYQLGRINQLHTKASIGLTFAAGLRSILRQDPDIIMVGEIRDRETAEICIRSALTGHLVLSTLHTNDAVSAVSRLTDMEIEPYLLTAALSLIMAQRLVRRICPECAKPWKPEPEILQQLKRLSKDSAAGSWRLLRGAGCARCGGTGYFGRIAIYEQFVITERIKALITEGAGTHRIEQAAREDGLQTLLQSALHKVREGVTTLDEALSVCATQSEVEGG